MAKNFEWRKDEDEGWEEPLPRPEPPLRPFRPYPLYFILVIVVGLGGWLGYRQLQNQVAVTAVSLEQEVRASAILLQQAVIEEDEELFDSLIAPEMGGRREREQRRLTVYRYWRRELFSWQWQPTAVTTPIITLSPDLQTAAAVMPQTYTVWMPDGVTETVVLSQTAVFHLDNGRWLLTLPDDEFWGEEQTIAGDYLTLLFPAREQAAAKAIFAELEALIQASCPYITSRDCPHDEQIFVRLDTDPSELAILFEPPIFRNRERPIRLPAPTLLGLPTDNHSLHIVATAYASEIVRSWMPTLIGWEEEYPIFYLFLRERMLLEMGLQPYFRQSLHPDTVLAEAATLQEISALWLPDDVLLNDVSRQWHISPSQITALFEFLSARGETAVSLHNRLLASDSFWEWANINPTDATVEREWLQFLYNRSSYAGQPASTPLPTSAIRLLCGGDLRRYDLAAHTWRRERPFSGSYSFIEVIPGDNGLILESRVFNEEVKEFRGQALLWQNGRQWFISEWRSNNDHPVESAQRHDPSGQKLVLRVRPPFEGVPDDYFLLDLQKCTDTECRLQTLPGLPLWSPDGRATLITTRSSLMQPRRLWLGDSEGQALVELGQGHAPFWLDDDTYGYIRLGNTGYSQVVTADSGDNAPRVIATVDGMLDQLPGPDNLLGALITAVQPNPAAPNELLITVLTGSDPVVMHLFEVVTEEDETIKTTQLLRNWSGIRITFAPDGRNLLIDKTAVGSNLRTVTLASADNIEQELFAFTAVNNTTYDWTADGQWLLLNHPTHLKLIAPAHNYQQFIFHDFIGCQEAQWVK